MHRMLRVVAMLCLAHTVPVRADDLRPAMEKENARWLAAFNSGDAAALPAMYTSDALLLPPGTQPVSGGADAIRQWWEARIKAGVREHTFEIVSIHGNGNQVVQVARWTAVVVKDSGERTPVSGNTVRVFERQGDGTWLTKVHIYNRHQ